MVLSFMKSWTPLWSMVVDSSLWEEPDYVVKIFLTMMALKDEDHVYRGTTYALAKRSHKTEFEVLEALKVLSSPDRRRIEKQEHDGRRIRSVEDGWLILNGAKYRDLMSEEMKKARNRRAQRAFRERQKERHKNSGGAPGAGEMLHEKGLNEGTVCPNCGGPLTNGACFEPGCEDKVI